MSGRGEGIPSIINDGNTDAWFDSAEAWITKDGSDFVSNWLDRSGNTNNLLQAIGTNQPLWTTNGVLFDGVDNFMKAVFTLIQPTFIYIVLNQISWTSGDYIFDGNGNDKGLLHQIGTTPGLKVYAGALSAEDSNLSIGSFGIARVLFNGVSSKFIINENTPNTGDFGAIAMDGFVFGARGAPTSPYGNIQVKEIIIRKIADAAGDEADIYNYLKSKYGIS